MGSAKYKTNKQSDDAGAAYCNELPDEATVMHKTTQRQKHHLEQNEIQQIITDYTERCMSVYQLADKYGGQRGRVSSILKRNGVTISNKRLHDEQLKKPFSFMNQEWSQKPSVNVTKHASQLSVLYCKRRVY
jgi:hypothetical protein